MEKVAQKTTPDFMDYWRLGFYNYRIGNLEKSKKYYEKALLLHPEDKKIKENLALTYMSIGQSHLDTDLEAAKQFCEKALEVYPGDRDAIKLLEKIQDIIKSNEKIRNLKESLTLEE